MRLPTSGIVWLETSPYGNGQYARVARSRTNDVLTVRGAYYDHQDLLSSLVQQARGETPIVIGVDFEGSRGTEYLHYHPGAQKVLDAKAAWNLFRALRAVGNFVEIIVEAQRGDVDPEAERRIPQDVKAMMTTRGVLKAPGKIMAANSYLRDRSQFPNEGYYYYSGSEMLITGKIRAGDIR
jgi:hypothetical protein